jgi:hypothetical protein
MATAIRRNGRTSGIPRCGNQPQLAAAFTHSDWPTPMRRAVTAATVNEDSSATSAAASAGTMARVMVVGLSDTIGAARTPARPANPEAMAQLPTSVRTGHQPKSDAARSFWETARVTMPKRVYRYTAARTPAAAKAIAARYRRSRPTLAPRMLIGSFGSTARVGWAWDPKWRTARAWRLSISPIDATTLASAGAWRSQRKMAR